MVHSWPRAVLTRFACHLFNAASIFEFPGMPTKPILVQLNWVLLLIIHGRLKHSLVQPSQLMHNGIVVDMVLSVYTRHRMPYEMECKAWLWMVLTFHFLMMESNCLFGIASLWISNFLQCKHQFLLEPSNDICGTIWCIIFTLLTLDPRLLLFTITLFPRKLLKSGSAILVFSMRGYPQDFGKHHSVGTISCTQ